MSGTTGPINGSSILLYCGGTALAYSTSHTLNVNMATIDVTSKDSAGWTDILPGLRDWSVDVEGFVALDSTTNYDYLYGLFSGRTQVMLKLSTNVSSDDYWHGYAYLTSLSMAAPVEDKITFSASFSGDGVLTKSIKT